MHNVGKFLCACTCASMLLSACGGGGGSGSSPGSATPPANIAPVANAGAAQRAATGILVTLDGSTSSDANGDALSYAWAISTKPAASSATLDGASTSKPSFKPDVAGDYVFSLIVQDGKTASSSVSVTVTVFAANTLKTSYTAFDSAAYGLYVWEGSKTAVLSRNPALDPLAMAALLKATDAAYTYYQGATGYTPWLAKAYNGKLTIADVSATCGAGCGYLGATGIELQSVYFDLLYNGVQSKSQFDQAVFYEFGRNFWHLSPQLEYKAPDSGASIVTGFAVFMRFLAMDAANVQGGPFNQWSYSDFRKRVEAMVDLYEADPSQNWSNTLQVGKAQANNPSVMGATDLFASMCLRLRRDYGGDAFVAALWQAAAKQPPAATTQAAVDNFFVAASTAAGKNLSGVFVTRWRWPVSAAAQAAVAGLPN